MYIFQLECRLCHWDHVAELGVFSLWIILFLVCCWICLLPCFCYLPFTRISVSLKLHRSIPSATSFVPNETKSLNQFMSSQPTRCCLLQLGPYLLMLLMSIYFSSPSNILSSVRFMSTVMPFVLWIRRKGALVILLTSYLDACSTHRHRLVSTV